MAFTPHCPPPVDPPVCEPPEPPVVCPPPPPPVVCEPEPPVVCEPVCPPTQNGGNNASTGDSTNTISQGGNAGNVVAGSGTYVDAGAGSGVGIGGLLNLSLLNGIGGSNILSPSIGGPSVGIGAIFESDAAGNGGNSGGGLLGSLFGNSHGKGGNGGDDATTGDSTNTISHGGDAGDVVAGDGNYLSAGTADTGSLINLSLLNGLGGSNILSPSIGGPSVGIGAIFESDAAGNGGNSGGGLLGSLFGNSHGKGGNGGDDAATGDSTNTVSQGGDAGDVVAGDGNYLNAGTADTGSLINLALLNGLGGSNILSPSIGGPSVGIGAIFENDAAGNGGDNGGGLLGSLFGNSHGNVGNGGDDAATGDSTNTISQGGDAGDVVAGAGNFVQTGATDLGGLINLALLNGVGGSNILSPSIGGPSIGIGAIFEHDAAGNGGGAYDGHIPLLGHDLGSALGSTLDLLTTSSSLFDVPTLDFLTSDGLDS